MKKIRRGRRKEKVGDQDENKIEKIREKEEVEKDEKKKKKRQRSAWKETTIKIKRRKKLIKGGKCKRKNED